MKLYIDINTGEIRRESSGPKVSSLLFYLRDITEIDIVFTDGGVEVSSTVLADNATMRLGLKSQPGNDLLATASSYVLAGQIATVTFSLNTDELIAYFSDKVGAGQREAPFVFEVQTTADDESTRNTYAQISATVRRNVNDPDDGEPSEADASLYVLKSALFDGSGRGVADEFLCIRTDITSAATHRALTTVGRTVPWVILTLEGGSLVPWTLNTKSGEVDDGNFYRQPTDHNASTNNVIWIRTALA